MFIRNKLICVNRVLLVMNLIMSISHFVFVFDFDQWFEDLIFFTIFIERKKSFQYRLEISFQDKKVLDSIVEMIIRFFSNYSFVDNRILEKASHRISHTSSSRVPSSLYIFLSFFLSFFISN